MQGKGYGENVGYKIFNGVGLMKLSKRLMYFLGILTLILTIISILSPFIIATGEYPGSLWSFAGTVERSVEFEGKTLTWLESHYFIELWGAELEGLCFLFIFIIQLVATIGLILFILKLRKDFLLIHITAIILTIIVMFSLTWHISSLPSVRGKTLLSLGSGYWLTILALVLSLITYLAYTVTTHEHPTP